MKKLVKAGMIAFAFGLIFVGADTVNAQSRRSAEREYREDIRDAQRDYRRDLRRGRNPYRARREYIEEISNARREYRRNLMRGRYGWYRYRNNRRVVYPYSRYNYRNGWVVRRY